MTAAPAPWLVVVDLQRAFAEPGSPWYGEGAASVVDAVAELAPHFGERVVFTRFVPPPEPWGSWRAYYEKWPFAIGTHDTDLWAVVDPWREARTVSSHTFSKWTPALVRLLGADPHITLCGLTTDCCVLATAFAAVDGGARVSLVADACGAKTPAQHAAALDLLRSRSPQLEVVTAAGIDAVCEGRDRHEA